MVTYPMRHGTLLALLAAATTLAAQPNRLSGPVDPRHTVALPGHVNRHAVAANDRGAVDAGFPLGDLSLVLAPSPGQQADLESFLVSVQDPASPDYQRWLTSEQFGDRFGLAQSDFDQVVAWLQNQGFTVHTVAPSRNWIAFAGNAGMVEQAFHTEIHRYVVGGVTHFANDRDPSVPAVLAGRIAAIRGLHDFLLHPPSPSYTSASGNHYLAPGDIATIYNVNSLYNAGFDGVGQKIVIAGQTAVNLSDIQNFRSLFGLAANTPQVVLVPGRGNPGTVKGDVVEADLDLEWAGAVARSASVIYVYSSNVLDAVQYAVTQNLAPVISLSYGGCETASGASSLEPIAQQANAQGITWLSASGDSGAAGCESGSAAVAVNGPSVSLPASLPEVTAVGGTRFAEGSGSYWNSSNGANLSSALSYIPETAWNDSSSAGLAATGGGPSAVFPKPVWQTGPGVPADGARDIPDVALAASANHDGAILCTGGSCASGVGNQIVGGTSLATPVFAAITVLVNQYRVGTGAQAKAGLGNINPSLYTLAQSSTDAFHDITTGNNIVSCRAGTKGCSTGSFGYSAGAGYDLTTGLGSVDSYRLAVEWKAYTPPAPAPAALVSVAVSPSTVTAGATATVTVRLSAAAPSGGAAVALSSSTSAFPVPSALTVPAGQTAASVAVKAASVTASAGGTVSATYLGVTKTASVTVSPAAAPPPAPSATLARVSIAPSSLAGGATAVLTVSLSAAAPSGGAAVSLSSSSSSAFPVPASVTVPRGASSASVTVHTAVVTKSTSVTVTAAYQSVTKTASVTLTAVTLPTVTGLTVSPASVSGGGAVTLTVTLSGPAPAGGAMLNLTSSSPALALPSQVEMPAGYSSGYLRVNAGSVSSSTAVTVTVSYNSSSKSATLTVTPATARR